MTFAVLAVVLLAGALWAGEEQMHVLASTLALAWVTLVCSAGWVDARRTHGVGSLAPGAVVGLDRAAVSWEISSTPTTRRRAGRCGAVCPIGRVTWRSRSCSPEKMDAYEMLELDEDASEDDIRRAYKQFAKRAHPDRQGGDEARMKALNAARGVLLDPQQRTELDRQRQAARVVPAPLADIQWTYVSQLDESVPPGSPMWLEALAVIGAVYLDLRNHVQGEQANSPPG